MGDEEHKSEVVQRSIVTLPFDPECVPSVANLLGVESSLAPFQLPGGEVYQLTIAGGLDPNALTLTLWPTIRRVDAISASATVVFTNVESVDLVEGVEVLFRRSSKEFLIITLARQSDRARLARSLDGDEERQSHPDHAYGGDLGNVILPPDGLATKPLWQYPYLALRKRKRRLNAAPRTGIAEQVRDNPEGEPSGPGVHVRSRYVQETGRFLIQCSQNHINECCARCQDEVAMRDATVLEVPLDTTSQVYVVRKGATGQSEPETTNGANRRQ